MKTWQRWVFTTGVAAFLVASAEAETVLWYQLDVLDIGVTSTLSTVIDNIANPGTYQMHCHSLVGINRGVVPEYMPSGTVGMPSGIWVYDPVTQEGGERLNAMHFGLTEIPPGTKSANGAMLRTDTSSPSDLGLTNVTVEAIFRTSAGALTDWSMAPIVYLPGVNNAGYKESVMLGIGWSGKLACRFNAEGTSRVVGGGSGPLVTPDVWHHAAFTLDAEGTGRLYLDYRLVHSLSGLGSLDQVPNKPLMIGANTHVAERTFPGDILEVRINDTAIGSGEFLQVRVPPRVTPDDTILSARHVRVQLPVRLVNVNAATGSLARTTNPMSETNSPQAVWMPRTRPGTPSVSASTMAGVIANAGSTHSVRGEDRCRERRQNHRPGFDIDKASFTLSAFSTLGSDRQRNLDALLFAVCQGRPR